MRVRDAPSDELDTELIHTAGHDMHGPQHPSKMYAAPPLAITPGMTDFVAKSFRPCASSRGVSKKQSGAHNETKQPGAGIP